MYSVDNDIPITTRKLHTPRKSRYPFATMAVGDSFFVAAADATACAARLRSAARKYAVASSAVSRKYKVRTTQEPSGARIWRTE